MVKKYNILLIKVIISVGSCVLNITLILGDPSVWKTCNCTAPCNKTEITATIRSSKFTPYLAQVFY